MTNEKRRVIIEPNFTAKLTTEKSSPEGTRIESRGRWKRGGKPRCEWIQEGGKNGICLVMPNGLEVRYRFRRMLVRIEVGALASI